MAARALVFDLDGTVWDSYPWLARVIGDGNNTAERAALAGLRDAIPAATLLQRAGVTRARFRSICAEAKDFQPYPGVMSSLGALRRKRVPLGVVTNLPAWVADPMLACLELTTFFGSVVDYGRTKRHKPDPEPILTGLAELGVKPSEDVWYVGDSVSDGEAARRAGVSFAWASYGYGAAEPDVTVAVIREFRHVLEL